MVLPETLYTEYGAWSPLYWIIGFIVALIISWIFLLMGESDYKSYTEQVKPYLSGNAEPDKGDVHIRAGNMYWGFTKALKRYYDILIPVHTGILTDYILWFLGAMALIMVIILGGDLL
ncbi:membrane bound hydrogenase subunit MbhI [Methanoplanus limicola DSM 2279]|uniref:Membrane bound hydrogenase subunit MbhI n=2 Tax=Methanoplanus limicola TaxID=2315 RepID=H1Z3Q9_9EURY|nr:membrane bound hydrogenase subunit MbhI [Methanoplanus limicola DSM 2279]